MATAFIEGAADAGVDVLDIGMVGTEMLYFAVGELGLDGGAAVTASHNPKEYTGMKIVRRGALPVGGDSGLLDIRDRAERGFGEPSRRGEVTAHDIYPAFVDRVLSFVDVEAMRPLRVVIDAANGMAGAMLPPVLDRLPIDAVRCFFEPDGTFPNHEPNPLLPENRDFIIAKVREEGADLGIAFDGDADRCFFVDDTGEFVPGDFVTALLAEMLLEREPGATVIYDVRASWAVPETVERLGGTALVNRVGHAFIKHRMRAEERAVRRRGVGPLLLPRLQPGRLGHRPRAARAGAALAARPAVLGDPAAAARALLPLRRDQHAGPGRGVEAPGGEGALGREGKVTHIDGLEITAERWHMNVRPSNTEPLLRLNLEALDRELMSASATRSSA